MIRSIDHLQGYIYNQVIDPVGAMYYEVDDNVKKPSTSQCRFLVGAEKSSSGAIDYHVRTYTQAGLECTVTSKGKATGGISEYKLDVKRK